VGEDYPIVNGILRTIRLPKKATLKIEKFSNSIINFYKKAPFPNYKNFASLKSLASSSDKSIFGRLLRDQIQLRKPSNILKVGCSMGQLSSYLAGTTNSLLYAADTTIASLELGSQFALENKIENVRFLEMDLCKPCI
jgi:cyclopropane fatty-acyl-phospholipid synthase-like methyltransferase